MSYTLSSSQNPDTPGHFRIGPVNLAIPPSAINLSRASNNDEVMPLRSKYSYEIKTGQARWDLTIQWKAVLSSGSSGTLDYSQWEDVRTILAMLKAAPFVDVENSDVRAILSKKDASMKYSRMAFALKQLTIQTSSDIVDGLDCTLNMSLFNYLPYTKDFSFQGTGGDTSADGNNSPAFLAYLDAWKKENLDAPYSQLLDPSEPVSPANWQSQNPDALNFSWRQYFSHKGAPTAVDPNATIPNGDLLANLPVDHFTSIGVHDAVTFRYNPRQINLSGGAYGNNANNLYVNQMAVSFTNNLAVIPLASFQYPTYQHIGPAGSMISFSFQQKGYDSTGLPLMSEMLETLEDQFLSYRNQWRKTSSVHRMQAIFVENQFLNMLGIFGMMDTQFNIQSTEESADIVEAQLVSRQYENIFESLDPYIVKGPLAESDAQFNVIFATSTYQGMTPDQQNAIKPVADFQNARKSLDQVWLENYFIANPNIMGQVANQVPLPSPLLPSEVTAITPIRANLSSAVSSFKSGPITYSDFFYMTRLSANQLSATNPLPGLTSNSATNNVATLAAIKTRLEGVSQVATTTAITNLYKAVFSARKNPSVDPAFAAALNNLLENPTIKAAFLAAAGQSTGKSDHGAYRDLGLKNSVKTLGEVNPASYFANQDDAALKEASTELIKIIPTISQGFNQLNQVAGSNSAVQTSSPELGIANGNPSGILERMSMPSYSMRTAFPTFKLFLMEEDNLSIYHMMDDFYSYSSVIDMEIENHRERGSTAVIRLTNLAGLLSHKLFDGSVLGKLEKTYYPFTQAAGTTAGGTVQGATGLQTSIEGSSLFGFYNYQEGVGTDGRPDIIPLQYFALQTGSKIQVRMGFDDDPDKLTPVFQGVVTEISGQEILEITAQGFQIELMKPTADPMVTDGWSPVSMAGDLWNSGKTWVTDAVEGHIGDSWSAFKSLFTINKGAAFGGLRLWGDGGDTGTVMGKMLQASGARHFGHWQVGSNTDQYLKGFTWEAMTGSWLDNQSTVGALLKTAYDRTEENILIDHGINADATYSKGRYARSWNFESPTQLTFGSPPQYYLPNDQTYTPWQIIRDISRRYPDYNLSVKNYGFPTGADATLVFGQPLDWYYARMPFIGEDLQAQNVTKSDAYYFDQWWKATGKAEFIALYHQDITKSVDPTSLLNGATVTASNIEALLDQIITDLNDGLGFKFSAFTGLGLGYEKQRITDFTQFRNRMQQDIAHLRSPNTSLIANNSSRLKPVRKFHYADHRNIIHNGITINDNFNNAVKLNGDVYKVNKLIPNQYARVVDVDSQVIAPEKNLHPHTDTMSCYVQSFLRDECGKMYSGELLLSLSPEVEYGDVVLIFDPSTGICGPIEVESVIHSFDQTSGAITIVRPRAWLLVNEVASLDILSAICQTIPQIGGLSKDFVQGFKEMSSLGQDVSAGAGVAGVVGAAGATALAVPIASAGLEAAIGAVALFGGPPGWIIGGLVGAGLFVAGCGIASMISEKNSMLNPMLVAPLSRMGRPWIGGLQGYRLSDYSNYLTTTADRWITEEIAPTLIAYRAAFGGVAPFSPEATAAAVKSSASSAIAAVGSSALLKRLANLPAAILGYIQNAAQQYNIPVKLLESLVAQESGGKLNAVNTKSGASGIMQLMPATAASLGVDLNSPQSQINGGAQLLAQNYKHYGTWALALAAYNAGTVAVSGGGRLKKGGPYIPAHTPSIPNYPETQQYVTAILTSAGLPLPATNS